MKLLHSRIARHAALPETVRVYLNSIFIFLLKVGFHLFVYIKQWMAGEHRARILESKNEELRYEENHRLILSRTLPDVKE